MEKPRISPSQGLLILIDKYPDKALELKSLYLSGAKTPETKMAIVNYLKDPALEAYEVAFDAQTINNDPSRRYFETHLAYESLANGLDRINLNDLIKHYSTLFNTALLHAKPVLVKAVTNVLNGIIVDNHHDFYKEYADYIRRIHNEELFASSSATESKNFSHEERCKIILLAASSFLGVSLTLINKSLAAGIIDIYGQGIFSYENRGKQEVADQSGTRSQHYGLMKGHMPLASNDVVRANSDLPFLKPSEQVTFVESAAWVKLNFEQMVHPFSNSISGTMLAQLRMHAWFKIHGIDGFTKSAEEIKHFGQMMTSAMLFYSGGHTLNEFTAPFQLDAVQDAFRDIPGFDSISLESMFLSGNEAAFDKAIADSIVYNNHLLMKQQVHGEIKEIQSEAPANSQSFKERLKTIKASSDSSDNILNSEPSPMSPSL